MGLTVDLVIEQCLMRSLKTSGGHTSRGNGMSEIQKVIWMLSMPIYSEYNNNNSKTNVIYEFNEQNKDLTQSRKKRDKKDLDKIL